MGSDKSPYQHSFFQLPAISTPINTSLLLAENPGYTCGYTTSHFADVTVIPFLLKFLLCIDFEWLVTDCAHISVSGTSIDSFTTYDLLYFVTVCTYLHCSIASCQLVTINGRLLIFEAVCYAIM